MERDLRDVMAENLGVREKSIEGLEPSSGALARTVRTVRRRRTVRHSVQAVGIVAAAGVLAAGSWLGLHGVQEPVPAVTPTPIVSTPAPSPTATPTPTPTAPPDEILGLPPTRPMPPGMLESTTSGWALAVYRSSPGPVGEPVPPSAHAVVLASPDGELYHVVDLQTDLTVELVRWDPGATTAIVRVDSPMGVESDVSPRSILDLTTGAIVRDDRGFSNATYYQGTTATGAELWGQSASTDAYVSELYVLEGDGAPVLLGYMGSSLVLDPTRRWVVTPDLAHDGTTFALIDVVEGGRTVHEFGLPGTRCDLVGWLDAGAVLAYCADARSDLPTIAATNPAWYRVDVDAESSTVTPLGPADPSEVRPWSWSGARGASGVVAFFGTTEIGGEWTGCSDHLYTWQAGSTTPVHKDRVGGEISGDLVANDGVLYSLTGTACREDAGPAEVSASHWPGPPTVLFPAPPSTPEVPVWLTGVGSWVVAAES